MTSLRAQRAKDGELGLGNPYNLHSLRHTAATWMLAAGVDVNTVQEILGHSAASTTLNCYAHVLGESKAKAVEAISARLRGA